MDSPPQNGVQITAFTASEAVLPILFVSIGALSGIISLLILIYLRFWQGMYRQLIFANTLFVALISLNRLMEFFIALGRFGNHETIFMLCTVGVYLEFSCVAIAAATNATIIMCYALMGAVSQRILKVMNEKLIWMHLIVLSVVSNVFTYESLRECDLFLVTFACDCEPTKNVDRAAALITPSILVGYLFAVIWLLLALTVYRMKGMDVTLFGTTSVTASSHARGHQPDRVIRDDYSHWTPDPSQPSAWIQLNFMRTNISSIELIGSQNNGHRHKLMFNGDELTTEYPTLGKSEIVKIRHKFEKKSSLACVRIETRPSSDFWWRRIHILQDISEELRRWRQLYRWLSLSYFLTNTFWVAATLDWVVTRVFIKDFALIAFFASLQNVGDLLVLFQFVYKPELRRRWRVRERSRVATIHDSSSSALLNHDEL